MDKGSRGPRDGREKLTRDSIKKNRTGIEGKPLPTYLDKRKEAQEKEDKLKEKNKKKREENIKENLVEKRKKREGGEDQDKDGGKEDKRKESNGGTRKEGDAKKKAEKYGLLGNKKGTGGFNDNEGKESKGRKRPNLLSYKSVKEDIIEGGIDDGAKQVLNKYGFGAGTFLEKMNRKLTGKDKVNYSKKMTIQGKLVIALVAVLIVVMAWVLMFLAFFVILFGAAALLMSDDDGSVSSGGNGGQKEGATTDEGNVSGKYKGMPPELQGKYLTPNMIRWGTPMGKRRDPVSKLWSVHYGVDMGTPNRHEQNWKVYPIAPGKIIYVLDIYPGEKGDSWGNHVSIDHGDGITALYAHLKLGIPVKVGDEIGITTILGTMGSTGWSANPHLHLEMFTGGPSKHKMASHRIDPMKYMSCTETTLVPHGLGNKPQCYEYQKKVRGI